MAKKKAARSQNSCTDRCTAYANAVVSGIIIAGPHVRASCRRHLDDLKNAHKRGLFYDEQKASRVFRFYENILRLNGGQFEGKPFLLDPSQCFIAGSLFGWHRIETGFRRFSRAFIEIGKGNGKSPFVAGIGLYGLVGDNESRAEIYAAASKRDQAMVLFRDAIAMVEQSDDLGNICLVSGGNHSPNIAYLEKGSFFRPISNDKGKSGPRPHMGLCDEVHEHPNSDTLEMLERGFKFRQNPLLAMITNSGFDKTSVCWKEHDHAVKVAHGDVEDDSTFSYVCALDEKDDPLRDPNCWVKANPLLGVTITKDYLAGVVAQAKAIPGKRNNILRLHFCVWTDASSAWMSRESWEACENFLSLSDYKGKKCWLGLDLSYSRDLTAVALVFENEKAGLDLFVDFFTPAETMLEREEKDRVPYRQWCEDGYITATDGKVIKLEAVAARLSEINSEFDVQAVSYDRYRHKELESDLDSMGVSLPMVEHPQGFRRVSTSELWMPSSVEVLENGIIEGNMRIAMNPVLRWNAASTVVREDPAGTGNRVFDKRKATGRIDGVVAAAMAIGAANLRESGEKSVYESRGALIL